MNFFNEIDPWATVAVALLAVMVVHFIRLKYGNSHAPGQEAFRRGQVYALMELHTSEDIVGAMERLQAEVENGKAMDPSPFDDGILEVLTKQSERLSIRANVLAEVLERMQYLEASGAASSSEVGVAIYELQDMLGNGGQFNE